MDNLVQIEALGQTATEWLPILLRTFYVSASLMVLVASQIESFRAILFPYGKALSFGTTASFWQTRFLVPKSWFSHFYWLGMSLSSLLQWLFTRRHDHVCLPLLAFQIHTARRLFECLFISKSSQKSRMHVTHYLVGLAFYTATSFAMVFVRESSFYQMSLGWILFSWASFEQYLAHSHLASLRSSGSSELYHLPTARYFRSVACPHYFFELLIYISFLIQAPDWTQTCIVLWVLTDLHFAAEQQWKWYHDKFEKSGDGANGLPKDWKRWIPGLI